MTRRATPLALLTFALLFVGCSAASPASPSPAASASSTPAAAATASSTVEPTGTPYHVNVPEAMRGSWKGLVERTVVTSGLWKLEITNNEIIATNPIPGAEPFPIGVTDINADQVTFWDDPECPDGGKKMEAIYDYALDGDQLTFTVVQDSCGDRRVLLVSTTWERQP